MTAASTRIRLSRPADVLGMVPYLVGFHPDESIVALLLKSGTVVLTMRVNMPPPEEATKLAADIAALCDQHGADALVIIGYSVHAEPSRELLMALANQLHSYALKDLLYTDGHRWWSLMCTATCCPPDGQPYDPSSSSVAAEAVYAGLGVRADRRALESEVSGPPDEDRDGLHRLAQQESVTLHRSNLPARCALMRTLVESGLASADPVDDSTCARMAVLATDVRVRDVAWSMISWEQGEHHLRLWARVVSRITAPFEAAPLCLMGFCAWVCGHGAMMNCCIERVLEIDPTYSMGQLLDKISRAALPPTVWDEFVVKCP